MIISMHMVRLFKALNELQYTILYGKMLHNLVPRPVSYTSPILVASRLSSVVLLRWITVGTWRMQNGLNM